MKRISLCSRCSGLPSLGRVPPRRERGCLVRRPHGAATCPEFVAVLDKNGTLKTRRRRSSSCAHADDEDTIFNRLDDQDGSGRHLLLVDEEAEAGRRGGDTAQVQETISQKFNEATQLRDATATRRYHPPLLTQTSHRLRVLSRLTKIMQTTMRRAGTSLLFDRRGWGTARHARARKRDQ